MPSHRQNLALTRDLVEAIAGHRVPITYAFHDPPTLRGTRQQPHLHLLISARHNDGHARTPAQHFRRDNRTHPARGGAQKDEAFRHRRALKAHRVLISDMLNVHLEDAGQVARVHPDTLEQRQLHRKPEPKLFPSESRAYREQGIISARMQEVLDIRHERASQRAHEQHQARTSWEERKVALGITRDVPMPAKLQAITQARAHTRDHAPEPSTRQRPSPVRQTARQWDRPRAPVQSGGPGAADTEAGPGPGGRPGRGECAACAAPGGGGAGARPDPRLGLLAWPGGHRRPPRGSSGSFQEAGKSGRLAGGAAPCAEARRAAVSQGAPV